MELSRQEYPAVLGALQPNEAVSVLNERVRLIGRINLDIADWLLERRKVEETYVQGLKKLAGRRQLDGAADLGIFQSPWQSIVNSTQSLAESHSVLARRIEVDVERPLREYQTKNREMQTMSTIQGNLTALAKENDDAQKKSEKLKSKGGKAAANKVSNATSDAENASQQWDSQAPFVFEQLQALDENRVNHLRDVLTQFQTHEVDQVERNRVTAESCLNTLLNVKTEEEISTFVARTSGRPSNLVRQQSRTATPSFVAPSTPSRSVDEGRSNRVPTSPVPPPPTSSFPQEQRKGGFSGLKRLGTVIGRRKQDPNPPPRLPSPDKRSKPSRNPLRRGHSARNMQQILSPNTSTTDIPLPGPRQDIPNIPEASQASGTVLSPSETLEERGELNGNTVKLSHNGFPSSSLSNGIAPRQTSFKMDEPQSRPSSAMPEESERDADGFNVPSSVTDDISRAQQEAGESEQTQFKLDIRNEPIQEEDGDAQTALSKVANTLRAQAQQAPPQRKPGTNRGRRDVRNTIFIPNPETPENNHIPESSLSPLSPFNTARPNLLSSEDNRSSDAQSIRSSHSMSSLTNTMMRHPDMHQAGLNASIVETVSAWFSNSQVTKAVVIGEVALAYNAPEAHAQPGTEIIRLENFPVLEKVAPNPTFINQIPSKMGEYTVDVSHLTRTSVAFKYKVHLEEANLATHAPIMLTPSWKVEPTQASVVLSYSFNPAFSSAARRSVSLQNVVIAINIENTKALSCLSKPVGNFSKEKSLIYWKLGDLNLDGYEEAPQKLLARFTTGGEAKPGKIEARWEISGQGAAGLGSGLTLSQGSGNAKEEGADPFADETIPTSANGTYKEVPVTRKLVSGNYIAN